MLHFSTPTVLFRRFGLLLLVLQFSLFVFGLAPFHDGYWQQIEPIVLFVYLLAALTALWIAYGLSKGKLALGISRHPVSLAIGGFVLWQLFVTLFAFSPWRSWFGPPSTGEGAGWYLAIYLCFLLIGALWGHEKYRRIILGVAAINLLVLTAMHIVFPFAEGETSVWRPVKYSDYLALLLGWGWLGLMCSGLKITRVKALLFLLLAAIVLVASENRLAMVILGAGLIVSVVAIALQNSSWKFVHSPPRFFRLLAVLGCLLPVTWYAISMPVEKFGGYGNSLGQRAVLAQIGLHTLIHEPGRLVMGDGWGRFTDDSFKYAFAVPEVHRFAYDEPSYAYTKLLNGYSDHSHSQPLEAVLSLGLPGLLLWFAIPLLILMHIPSALFWRVAPPLVAMVTLAYFWFPLPQMLAYQALGWALLAKRSQEDQEKPFVLPSLVVRQLPRVAIALCALFGWSVVQQANAIFYSTRLMHAIYAEPAAEYSPAIISEDVERGGDRLNLIAKEFVYFYTISPAGRFKFDDNAMVWYRYFLYAAQRMADDGDIGVRNRNLLLMLQNSLLMNHHMAGVQTAKLLEETRPYLRASVVRAAETAPLRVDLAMPAIWEMENFKEVSEDEKVALYQLLLNLNPRHSLAMWFLGKALAEKPDYKTVGEDFMQTAKDMGVERVYPVNRSFDGSIYNWEEYMKWKSSKEHIVNELQRMNKSWRTKPVPNP